MFKRPMHWVKAYWEEDDGTYFFEADEDGRVLRQVVLQGSDRTPTVAASLADWPDVEREGLAAAQAYFAEYGMTSDKPITKWDFPHVKIAAGTFEKVWTRARDHLDAKRGALPKRATKPRTPLPRSRPRWKTGLGASRSD